MTLVNKIKQSIRRQSRNPWCLLTRWILAVGFTVAVWNHAWLLGMVIVLCVLFCPLLFAAPTNEGSFFYRAAQGHRIWLHESSSRDQAALWVVGIVLWAVLCISLYHQRLLPSVILGVTAGLYEIIFLLWAARIPDTSKPAPDIARKPPGSPPLRGGAKRGNRGEAERR